MTTATPGSLAPVLTSPRTCIGPRPGLSHGPAALGGLVVLIFVLRPRKPPAR